MLRAKRASSHIFLRQSLTDTSVNLRTGSLGHLHRKRQGKHFYNLKIQREHRNRSRLQQSEPGVLLPKVADKLPDKIECWSEWERPALIHVFGCLVPNWWNCLGRNMGRDWCEGGVLVESSKTFMNSKAKLFQVMSVCLSDCLPSCLWIKGKLQSASPVCLSACCWIQHHSDTRREPFGTPGP